GRLQRLDEPCREAYGNAVLLPELPVVTDPHLQEARRGALRSRSCVRPQLALGLLVRYELARIHIADPAAAVRAVVAPLLTAAELDALIAERDVPDPAAADGGGSRERIDRTAGRCVRYAQGHRPIVE